MFLINNSPANAVIESYLTSYPDKTDREVYNAIVTDFNEEWFITKTPSLKGSDNRLFHRIRTVKAALKKAA